MILFEFGLSSDDVQRVRNCDGGKELHAAGLFATIFNHLVFGPITYYLTVKYGFIQQHDRAFWQQLFNRNVSIDREWAVLGCSLPDAYSPSVLDA